MRFLILALILCFLTSCSRVSFGYRFADWVLEDVVDDYLDLTSEQEDQLEKKIDEYFDWHRAEMVPRYISHLEKVKVTLENENWDQAHLDQLNKEAEKMYYDTASPFKKIISPLLVNLSDEQIQHLENKITEQNKEKDKEYGRPEESRLKEKAYKNIKMFKKWFGSVSGKQKSNLQQFGQKIKFPVPEWLTKRKKQQQQLLSLLKDHEKNPALFEEFLELYIAQKPTPDTRLYYSELNDFREALRAALVEVLKNISPQQKKYFIKRLDRLIKDFKKISKKT